MNDYNTISIIPSFSNIKSREEVDISTTLGPLKLTLPIISANMRTITGPAMVNAMCISGGLGILHRFDSIEQNIEDFKTCINEYELPFNRVGVSIGVNQEGYSRLDSLMNEHTKIVTIDVAHGHHILVKEMIEHIKKEYDKDIIIIAGNVATPDGAYDLFAWGAHIIKVGIGPGFACTTRRNTGVGIPQLEAIQNIREKYSMPLISDGGIKTVGDIAKTLAIGADGVMVGAILAGTTETPGKVYPDDSTDLVNRTFYKVYGGSSSAQNQGENRFVEGRVQTIPFKGRVKYILKEIKEGLQSSFSYCGARNIKEFREKVQFINV